MAENHDHQEVYDTYIIPPNFIDTGTVLGGMFKLRNALEAVIIVIGLGVPLLQLPFSLTTRIIIFCITALPLTLLALIGVAGESLSSFVFNFFRFLKHRRIVYRSDCQIETQTEGKEQAKRRKSTKAKRKPRRSKEDFADEFAQERKGKKRNSAQKPQQKIKRESSKRRKEKPIQNKKTPKPQQASNLEEYLPIQKIEHGMIYTKDGRYLRILEIEPINFLLRSAREQRNVIYSFVSYLKICPVKLQIKVLTKKADINRHLEIVRHEMEQEADENCRLLQKDYIRLVREVGTREAVTRRFFLIMEYEPMEGSRRTPGEAEIRASLETAAETARNYFRQCGNNVIEHDDEDEAQVEVLYSILNRRTSQVKPLSERIREVMGRHMLQGEELETLPVNEIVSPENVDFSRGHSVFMDGLYHAYLIIPSNGYKSRVSAGWMSLLVNAGEGIDVDLFFFRQPKDRVIQKLGQQLRINRSKIKEASDTNTDFDDLEGAIASGYYLKEGLGDNQDLFYLSTLITITAETEEDLEWRVNAMRRLLISQDIQSMPCSYRGEQALLSVLPLGFLNKALYEKSKRNALTTGVASCYPFVSYEISDDNGILLGINKHNNSLVITDIFNTKIYKSANISVLGCTGAGKTFLIQLLALRMRRRGIQTFIIAPIKGHEFRRACTNIGGSFIQISPASENCINIMEIRQLDHSVDEMLDGPSNHRSELAAKIQQLHIFFALLVPDMTHEERQLLDEAMVQTYARNGITHDNASLMDPDRPGQFKVMPILGDLHEVLKASAETKRLANILSRLVTGSARSFNQQTNVPLDNLYTVLDLSDLTGDLLPVGMFVALDYVWDKVKEDRTREKAVITDELWQLIGASSNRLAADFVLQVAKIIRAYSGSGIFATQDLNDFFALDDGKYGRGIINACKTKIVLNLEDEEALRVQNILRLSESETMAITHFERGNGLIISNNNTVSVEFKASQLETELITTDRKELQQLLKKKGQS